MIDYTAQARELLAEIELAEKTADELGWEGTATEATMRNAIASLRHTAEQALTLGEQEPDALMLKLWRSAYDSITELREWRLNMEWVMERVPAMRRHS